MLKSVFLLTSAIRSVLDMFVLGRKIILLSKSYKNEDNMMTTQSIVFFLKVK